MFPQHHSNETATAVLCGPAFASVKNLVDRRFDSLLERLHIKPTRYAANILGGLLFGVGFALLGYCPGTGAAALGQGNWDAIAGVVGLIAGSYLFAECSGWLGKTVMKWGERGKLMLPELLGIRLSMFLLIFVPALIIAIVALDRFTAR